MYDLRKTIRRLVEEKKFNEKSWDFEIGKLAYEYRNAYTLEQIRNALNEELPKNRDRKGFADSKLTEKKQVYQFYVINKGFTFSQLLDLDCKYRPLFNMIPKIKSGEISIETFIKSSRNGGLNKLFPENKTIRVNPTALKKIDLLKQKLNLESRGMVVERAIKLLEKQFE